ncbi:hypothetical protein M3Y97_00740900 [Aphelenchoides bicaudatus]|nr:hypothetical protein M3Y97_00740900 [Aphelenchoides bicaudatus]
MAAPVPHRTSSAQNYAGSFPPPVYYRDTFGLQPANDRRFSESVTTNDSDSDTTKSTIRTTMNIYHPIYNNNRMHESQYTDATGSYHVEQIVTNQVIIQHPKALLVLVLCAFGSAVQLLMFAIISIFFDGSPYKLCLIASILFLINASLLFYFLRIRHSRQLLTICCCTTSFVFICCVALFFWTAYLIYGEDKRIRTDGFDFSKQDLQRTNHIVSNTRVAMYSLHMIFTPIQAVCCAGILYILYKNLHSIKDGEVLKGYFFSRPMGNQTVLVPIELKQVKSFDELDDFEKISTAVQTSGTRGH